MIFQQQSDLNDSKELSEFPSKKHEIDVFILKARWPDTACYILKLGNESSICSLPKEKNWIVAGLWPEIIGTNKHINCNSSATFDLNQLAKIRADLNAKFISVGPMNDTSLWERAWYSHGTCGSKVPEINSQFKYFNKTLELFNKYDIQGAFKSNNITIGNEYDAKEILAAIERTFGKHGMTACKFMTKISKHYLHEVSLCFDKTFNLIHCDGIRPQLTDCPRKKLITIPNIQYE